MARQEVKRSEMNIVKLMWAHLVTHGVEIGWAAVFGLIFAAVFDVVGPESRIRELFRRIKNRWSEYSVARLDKRIKQLELQRDNFIRYAGSDRALYLNAFKLSFTLLILMAVGLAVSEMSPIMATFPTGQMFTGPYAFLAFTIFGTTIAVGIQGIKLVSLDSPSKMTRFIGTLNTEIGQLKAKLYEMDPDLDPDAVD